MSEISKTGDQMLAALEATAAHGPLRVAEVASHCGLNRTVAHRLMATLAQRSYVRRTEAGYVVGPAVQQLARSAPDLRSIAKTVMTKLALVTGETVVLHAMDNAETVVLEQALGKPHLLRVEHSPGSRQPLYLGASGWSILAFQPEKAIARILRKVEDPDAARTRIAQVRRSGYALSHDELQQGVHGLAAPLRNAVGECRACITLIVPTARAAPLEGSADQVVAAAAEISQLLIEADRA